MDCRCPICSQDLGRRKLGHAIVARMEIECVFCKNPIRLNVHRAEHITVLASFCGFLALAGIAYLMQSQALAVIAFGAAMLDAMSLPVLERTYLRDWPRYARIDPRSEPPGD